MKPLSILQLPKFQPKQQFAFDCLANEKLLGGATRGGKLLDLNTLVPTPNGWSTVGQLEIGQNIFGQDGNLYKILDLSPIDPSPVSYELTFDNGERVTCCADHLWKTFTRNERIAATKLTDEYREKRRASRASRSLLNPKTSKKHRNALIARNKSKQHEYKLPPTATVRTTQHIVDSFRTSSGHINHSIPVSNAIELPDAKLPISPYVLGAWLGDGTSCSGGITGVDQEVFTEIERCGFKVTTHKDPQSHTITGLLPHLRSAGVLNNKHVPIMYLRASQAQRLELLQGLMDTDGTCDKDGGAQFTNTSKILADAVYELVASLGWKPFISSKNTVCVNNGVAGALAYNIKFCPNISVFKIKRKAQRLKSFYTSSTKQHYIVAYRRVDPVPMRCITVENPEKLFLISKSFIATHNTFYNKLMLIRLCSAVSNLRTDIFRLHLDDVYESYMEGDGSFPELLAIWERDGLVKITNEGVEFLWNGSGITLKHLGSDRAKSKGQGTPVQVRIYDEATQLMESRFRFLRGWIGMTEPHREAAAKELEKVFPQFTHEERFNYFPQIVYSTNPIGPSAGYFRRNFVKAASRYQIFKAPPEDGGFNRIYIPFKVADNKFENEEAVRARISGLGDAAMVDALLNENWDAPVGDFIREYDEKRHVVPDFTPPNHWIKFRGFDWGHSEPFVVLWACVSDGEPFTDGEGRERWFRRGALIIYREWNGCDPEEPAKGLGLSNVKIAQGIVNLSLDEVSSGITITDSLPFQPRGGVLIADEFMKNGCPLTRGNTAREIGWKKVKDLFIGVDGDPLLLITESCKYLREYVPALQRHATKPEDAVEGGEATHSCDVLRYLCMTHQITIPKKPAKQEPLPQPHLRKSITPDKIIKQIKKQKARTRGR